MSRSIAPSSLPRNLVPSRQLDLPLALQMMRFDNCISHLREKNSSPSDVEWTCRRRLSLDLCGGDQQPLNLNPLMPLLPNMAAVPYPDRKPAESDDLPDSALGALDIDDLDRMSCHPIGRLRMATSC